MNHPDMRQAREEGWTIFSALGAGHEIIRTMTETGNGHIVYAHASDEAAQAFVQARAREGSPYHIECLAFVAFADPPARPKFPRISDVEDALTARLNITAFTIPEPRTAISSNLCWNAIAHDPKPTTNPEP